MLYDSSLNSSNSDNDNTEEKKSKEYVFVFFCFSLSNELCCGLKLWRKVFTEFLNLRNKPKIIPIVAVDHC